MGSCVYGASVKSGLDPNTQIAVSRDLWESVTGAPTSWLDWFFDLWTPSFIKASDLCAINLSDPALPSVSDIVAGYGAAFLPGGTMYRYVQQKLEYVAFSNACACNSPGPTSCATTGGTRHTYVRSDPIGDKQTLTSIPAHLVRATAHIVNDVYTESANNYFGFRFGYWDGANVYHSLSAPDGIAGNVGLDGWWDLTGLTITKLEAQAVGQGPYPAGIGDTMTITYSCDAGPTTPISATSPAQPSTLQLPSVPTCGTEQDVCNRLSQLQQQIQSVMAMVTLIQRQRSPYAYLQGASSAISGAGVVAVQGILGVSLTLSDSRSGIGNYPDNPTTFFDLGWLSFCTADGCENAQQIRRHNQLFLEVNPAVTSVRYSLPSGVSGTLIPLVREP